MRSHRHLCLSTKLLIWGAVFALAACNDSVPPSLATTQTATNLASNSTSVSPDGASGSVGVINSSDPGSSDSGSGSPTVEQLVGHSLVATEPLARQSNRAGARSSSRNVMRRLARFHAIVDGPLTEAQAANPQNTTGLTRRLYSPLQLRAAYGIDAVPMTANFGYRQTICIVDEWSMLTIQSDLELFSATYNLPWTPETLKVIDLAGGMIDPEGPGGWDVETALDVEYAHAIAPRASIILVTVGLPPTTADLNDLRNLANLQTAFLALYRGVDQCVQAGANVVSMSWGSLFESSDPYCNPAVDSLCSTSCDPSIDPACADASMCDPNTDPYCLTVCNPDLDPYCIPADPYLDRFFRVPNVAFVAASGDLGSNLFGNPANSPYVLAAGGTSLNLDRSNRPQGESAWAFAPRSDGSGGGLSEVFAAPDFQSLLQTYEARAVPDVAYAAAEDSRVPVLDSEMLLVHKSPWLGVYGTSAAAPQWAGILALANTGRSASSRLSAVNIQDPATGNFVQASLNNMIYAIAKNNPTAFNDIQSGCAWFASFPDPSLSALLTLIFGGPGTPPPPSFYTGSPQNYFCAVSGYDLVTGQGSPNAGVLVPALWSF